MLGTVDWRETRTNEVAVSDVIVIVWERRWKKVILIRGRADLVLRAWADETTVAEVTAGEDAGENKITRWWYLLRKRFGAEPGYRPPCPYSRGRIATWSVSFVSQSLAPHSTVAGRATRPACGRHSRSGHSGARLFRQSRRVRVWGSSVLSANEGTGESVTRDKLVQPKRGRKVSMEKLVLYTNEKNNRVF